VARAERAVRAGDYAAARDAFLAAHRAQPAVAAIVSNLAAATLRADGADAALPWLIRAAELDPKRASAHVAVATVLTHLGRAADAMPHYGRAVECDPACDEAQFQLGLAALAAGDVATAAARLDAALAVKPDDPRYLVNRGVAFDMAAEHGRARALFERALVIEPKQPLIWSNLLMAANYDPDLTPAEVAGLHRRIENVFPASPRRRPRRTPSGRIKVGYVSADFRGHVGASQLLSIVRHHDRARFEVACYVANRAADTVTGRFKALADLWRPIADLDDAAAADLITADGIDVLVDFAGHSDGTRLGVFARQAAPVQVSLPGYVATTGLTAIDYRITDRISDPDDSAQALYAEKLAWLPEGHFSYEPLVEPPPPSPRAGAIVFGSFHNRRKYNARVIDTWADILRCVPESRLLLKDRQFGFATACDDTRQAFAARGIDPARLDFLGHVPDLDAHYRCYHGVDVALDPFPFNGTTTTLDALLMGVPVVALMGDRHVARLAANILTRIGRPDLIAATRAGYIDLAATLAAEPARRADLRRTLRAQVLASPIIEAARVVRSLEAFYLQAINRVEP
jgi:predicted O-linked N-acetylglucosamine transferase (SPINDLY family)